MGVAYEMNWYLVVEGQKSILQDSKNNITFKKGKRLYPVGSIIPMIHKNYGCVALVEVAGISIGKAGTCVRFNYVENLENDSHISNHYYDMYLKMKNESKGSNTQSQ